MPRKAAAKPAGGGGAKKGGKGAYKLADPLPAGEVLKDLTKGQWVTGASVGVGGFGLIYLATPADKGKADASSKFVVKVEPKSNGPLFSELSFYQRVAKEAQIHQFKSTKKLKSLGMPRFVASGQHDKSGTLYRFMVMERFNTDLQKTFEANGKRFSEKTVYTLGIQMLDVLEYIHSQQYVHADIKASNMLMGFDKSQENQAYLVDYGLAAKYSMDNKHKEYKEDPRRCHDGTIEFTSIDAHKGVGPSRRGDLEILGYCMLQWLCGQLPWEDKLLDKEYVRAQKIKYMNDIPSLMKKCSLEAHPDLKKYLQHAKSLDYHSDPDYNLCRKLFRDAIKKFGGKDDGKLELTVAKATKKPAAKKTQSKKRKSDSTTEDDISSQEECAVNSPKRSKTTARPRAKGKAVALVDAASSPAVSRVQSPAASRVIYPAVMSPPATSRLRSPATSRIQSPATSRVQSPSARASPRAKVQSPSVSSTGRLKSPPPARGAMSNGVAKPRRKKPLVPKFDVAVQTSPGLKGLKRSRQEK